ncbi:MAG: prepilin peptidase, partial [Chloroflexota bacterium]
MVTVASAELVVTWALTGALAATLIYCAMRRHEKSAPSPWRTLAQVLTTAALFAALAWRLGWSIVLLAPSWLAATGVALAAIDLRSRRLPNRLVLPSYLAIPGLAAATVLNGTDSTALIRATLGMTSVLICYGLLYAVFPGHLGGGDLKLAGPIGFLLAWQGWSALLTGTLLTWVLATLALPLSSATWHRTGGSSLPLGP